MTEYKCGHESGAIILDTNELSLSQYQIWKDTVGFDGDNSLCFKCYIDGLTYSYRT